MKTSGDISMLTAMSQRKGTDEDDLANVEDVFEKNIGTFNSLIS